MPATGLFNSLTALPVNAAGNLTLSSGFGHPRTVLSGE